MREESNNQIAQKNETFWKKVKSFMRKIFYKKDINNLEEKVENETSNQLEKVNNFAKEVKIENNPETERLVKLQEDFREGKISQGDLSDEDIEKLGKLYDEQIAKLKIQIEDCKKRIEDKKQKLQNG